MSSIEGILAEHHVKRGIRDGRVHCCCGWGSDTRPGDMAEGETQHRTHVADAIRALLDGPTDTPARCGSVQPNPAPGFKPYACIRQAGHVGKHGYAGIFWDDPTPEPVTADELADALRDEGFYFDRNAISGVILRHFHVTRRADT